LSDNNNSKYWGISSSYQSENIITNFLPTYSNSIEWRATARLPEIHFSVEPSRWPNLINLASLPGSLSANSSLSTQQLDSRGSIWGSAYEHLLVLWSATLLVTWWSTAGERKHVKNTVGNTHTSPVQTRKVPSASTAKDPTVRNTEDVPSTKQRLKMYSSHPRRASRMQRQSRNWKFLNWKFLDV